MSASHSPEPPETPSAYAEACADYLRGSADGRFGRPVAGRSSDYLKGYSQGRHGAQRMGLLPPPDAN